MKNYWLKSLKPILCKVFCSNSLRWRLTSFFGLILLGTLLLEGISIVSFVNRTEVEAWHGRQGEAARGAAQTVGDFIRRASDSLSLLGLLGRDELEQDPGLIGNVLEQNLALQEVVYLDDQGRMLAAGPQDHPLLANLFTIPQSQWFQQARQGQAYYGSLQTSASDKPYLIIALPAPSGSVVAARLDMTVLWNVVSDIHFGQTGRAYIVSRAGQVIAHTNPAVVMAQTNISERGEWIEVLHAPHNEWSGEYTDLQGQPVVGVTAPVPGADWVVITELPQQEAFATSRNAYLFLGGGLVLFGLFITIIGAHYLDQVIFQPIEELGYGSQRIGQGNLDYRIRARRQDEVGQVATAFNNMANSLQQRDAQLAAQAAALRDEVAERTQAQEALRQLNAELEQRVANRTLALKQINDALRVEIAERQRVEEALRQSELKYRLLIEEMPAVTYMARLEDNGTTVYASPQIKNLLGYSVEEWLGDPDIWFRQMHPDDRERVITESMARLNSGRPFQAEYRLFTRQGDLVWVQDQAVSLPNDGSSYKLIQGMMFDITARKQAEEQIKASLYEKEMLLKEIHHRVKNNLQVISSLLNLQSSYISDPQTLEFFQDSQNRIRSMALIHEKLYRSRNLAQIDLGDYVQDLASFLVRSYNASGRGIRLKVQAVGVHLGIDTAVPCGLIINELISNSLKHAFPDSRVGQIYIHLNYTEQNQTQLIVGDTGVGFPKDLDFRDTTSLGLQLVNTLVGQLDGTIELHNGDGTEFRICFATQ